MAAAEAPPPQAGVKNEISTLEAAPEAEAPQAEETGDARGWAAEHLALVMAHVRPAATKLGLMAQRPAARLAMAGAGVAVVSFLAVGLAEGTLIDTFRSSWAVRVAGITDTADDGRSLAVETRMPLPANGAAQQPAGSPPKGQEFAGIQDVAQVSSDGTSGKTIHILNTRPDYLPPDAQYSGMPEADVTVTVPVSQGRLLRFDEAAESVFVADPGIADIRVVSPDLVYVFGKRLGYTNLMAVSAREKDAAGNAGPRLAGTALLRVVADPRPAQEAKQQLSPDAPVNIQLFGQRAAIKGHFESVDQAVDVANVAQTYSEDGKPPINSATIGGSNQINIRVRFAEVSRNDLKSFGIDWNVAVNAGNFSFGLQKSTNTFSPALDPNLGLQTSAGNFDIDLLIEALQANGALTVLAEPNLTAVTGETASFLAGGEVPIPVPGGTNREIITVQYKPFGVSLAFTPTLVKDNRIALRVKPEVSAIAATTNFGVQGFNLPSFTVRRAETVVEIASGQTFALGGLFQREVQRSVEKLPVLGDVPVLGPLFRSERYQRNETELVILITPYLVNPVSDRKVATPLDPMDPLEPDNSAKGAAFTGPESSSGFIMK